MDINKLTKYLLEIDNKIRSVDEELKSARIKLDELVWDLVELKKKNNRVEPSK